MRRFRDTLPTLREAAPSGSEAHPASDSFDPAIIARALSGRVTAAETAGQPPAHKAAPTCAAGLERALARLGDAKGAARGTAEEPAAAVSCAPAEARPSPERPAARDGAGTPPRPAKAPIPPIDASDADIETRIAEAAQAARQKAEAEAERALEAARADERERARREMEEARTAWCEAEGERLAGRIDEALETLHVRLSDAFGRAVGPVLAGAVREAAVRRFAAVLDDLVADGGAGPALTVNGPGDLLSAIERSTANADRIAFVSDGAAEASVSIDDTRLETVVGAWADDLASAMGQADER
jgi:hypothetical protein